MAMYLSCQFASFPPRLTFLESQPPTLTVCFLLLAIEFEQQVFRFLSFLLDLFVSHAGRQVLLHHLLYTSLSRYKPAGKRPETFRRLADSHHCFRYKKLQFQFAHHTLFFFNWSYGHLLLNSEILLPHDHYNPLSIFEELRGMRFDMSYKFPAEKPSLLDNHEQHSV